MKSIKRIIYTLFSISAIVLFINSNVDASYTYTVKQDGTGDYISIAQGVLSVPDGSTLLIYPGTYNEHVEIINKTVNLIGVERNTCILQYDTKDYYQVPLNFGAGTIKNLTIRGFRTSGNTPIGTNDPNLGKGLSADEFDNYVEYFRGNTEYKSPANAAVNTEEGAGYAIHIDQDYSLGKAINIINCNIISEHASCIGMGLRKGARVSITGCIFTSSSQGIMFFHDSNNPLLSGPATLSITGCSMNSNGSFLMMSTSLNNANTTSLTLRNNVVSGTTNCVMANLYEGPGLGWMGLNNVILTKSSTGNNVPFMNR